jgi:hypothetical protein
VSGRKEGILGIEGALPTHWKISDEQRSLRKENKILKGIKNLFCTQEVLWVGNLHFLETWRR